MGCFPTIARLAGVAQLVERLTCNEDVVGSTPVTGSITCPQSQLRKKGAAGVFIPCLFIDCVCGVEAEKHCWGVCFANLKNICRISSLRLTVVLRSSKIRGLIFGGIPERSKGADCKSAGSTFGGSNPPPSTIRRTGAGKEK